MAGIEQRWALWWPPCSSRLQCIHLSTLHSTLHNKYHCGDVHQGLQEGGKSVCGSLHQIPWWKCGDGAHSLTWFPVSCNSHLPAWKSLMLGTQDAHCVSCLHAQRLWGQRDAILMASVWHVSHCFSRFRCRMKAALAAVLMALTALVEKGHLEETWL